MKKKLLIIGASGHGKVIGDIALLMNKWESIVFLDDDKSKLSALGLNVIGKSEDALGFIDDYDIFVGIGNNTIREKFIEKLIAQGASVPLLIHPSATIGKEVELDCGTVVMAGAVINSSTSIGRGCIINTGCTIDHDNHIGDYVHISPGAHLAGEVRVGNKVWIGVGCSISNHINIVGNCIVGAGAVVVKDITEAGTFIGVPARKIIKKVSN